MLRGETPTLRRQMVERQIRGRGVGCRRTLEAMARVPRERFVPESLTEFAYEDTPLPIGDGQTISQPYVVAYMIEMAELSGGEKVLEIGTGSGYSAAVLAEIAASVYTIERNAKLADGARERLSELGYHNVYVRCGDGTRGWAEAAPFDAILVTAGGPEVPLSLREQLVVGGCLHIPVGSSRHSQKLTRVRRFSRERFEEEDLGTVAFVPLIGSEGWPESPSR